MKRTCARAVILGSFLAFRFAMGVVPAFAQVPPIPPLPQPTVPAPAQPVLEILGPTIYPQCGTATLVVFLIGSSEEPIAPQLYSATAPVFAICGQVPRPETQLTCLFDAQAQDAVSAVTAQVGVPLPLGLHPEGDIVEQTITIEDRLPPPLNAQGLGGTAKIVLGCAEAASTPPAQGDYSVPPSYAPPPTGSYTYPPPIPATNPGTYTPPSVTTPYVPPSLAQPPATTPAGEAVRYAAVWLLPLGLLLFGGYFGGALTRDIDPSSPSA